MDASDKQFGIGEIAQRTGLSVHALRYYEREGSMLGGREDKDATPQRTSNGWDSAASSAEVACHSLRCAATPSLCARARQRAAMPRLLREQQRHIEGQLDHLSECIQVITRKVAT